jgi:biopolymer transport protein ExbD
MSISSGNGRQRQTFNEINITPLTDVFLVLLVIMFLIAPLLDNQAALKVDPPAAQSAQTTDPSKIKSIMIEVAKDGTIAVNGESVVQAAVPVGQVQDKVYKSLVEQAKATGGEETKEKPVVKLKADNAVDYGRVVAVLDAVNRAQLGKLSLVTTVQQASGK